MRVEDRIIGPVERVPKEGREEYDLGLSKLSCFRCDVTREILEQLGFIFLVPGTHGIDSGKPKSGPTIRAFREKINTMTTLIPLQITFVASLNQLQFILMLGPEQ